MLLVPEKMIAGLEGMELLQTAMNYHLGKAGVIFIAVTLFLFSFSTFLGSWDFTYSSFRRGMILDSITPP